ncbi:MAG: hypothetical protein IJ503_01245 [Akkermansia sp.]|nr:hypothetical protein [Akkermansia sp.]
MNIPENIKNKLLDWYWDFGCKRTKSYELSRGGWLDRAYRIAHEADSVRMAQTTYARPTIALWGPSQSGKSTMLARFLDPENENENSNSAISWDGTPARFCGKPMNGVAILNPFSKGADASGCVTRFHMTDSVKYPEYPIEVQFAGDHEIMMTLAVGYLSETAARNAKGEQRKLYPNDIKTIADEACRRYRGTAPNKAAYVLLTEALNVLNILIETNPERYDTLRSEWPDRRFSLLNNDALCSSVESVIWFICEVFWDNWSNMNEAFKQLRAKSATLRNRKYYCGIEIASLLLDISSASYYYAGEGADIKALVDSCTYRELENGDVAIVRGESKGNVFADGIDFALVQGLVHLIHVPLRKEVIETSHPTTFELLSKADLLDFPGVANEQRGAEPLTNDKLAFNYRDENGKQPLHVFIKVMKRGKTASIVISSARNLNIDAFSLLVRMPAEDRYPSNPIQLMQGIRQWFKSMGQEHAPLSRKKELPINLILTFSATLVNVVNASGTGKIGLADVFDKLKGLGDLADPAVVKFFCLNYPMFLNGRFLLGDEDSTQEEINTLKKNAIGAIMEDADFRRLFPDTSESLLEMADLEEGKFGGLIYLFGHMISQVEKTNRQALLEQKAAVLDKEWSSCIAEVIQEVEENAYAKDIEAMIKAINENPLNLKDEEIAKQILDFEDISPDVLEPVNTITRQVPDYLIAQLKIWSEAAKRKPLQRGLGFTSPEHRARVLSYLIEKIDLTPIVMWIAQFNRISAEERKELRRLVATIFSKEMFPIVGAHKHEADCVATLEALSANSLTSNKQTNRKDDIYYVSVIAPFLNTLDALKNDKETDQLGEHPGDEELAAICNK